MTHNLTVLGIESSCDDTAAAVLRCSPPGGEIMSSVVFGQGALHAEFGGVVPEIAARAHAEKLDLAVEQALGEAGCSLRNIGLIAVTSGPGLIGGVMSGVMCARGLAAGRGLPLIGVNHLAGHALTPRLTDNAVYPYVMLLVSGGHCQFLLVQAADRFTRLGGTIDDAPGEAFDKVARILGLEQPGGPAVERAARDGDPRRFRFPRPLLDRDNADMSFSGLKTAVLRQRDQLITDQGGLYPRDRQDICAGFQAAICDVLSHKTRLALDIAAGITGAIPPLAVAGGVAANTAIRSALTKVSPGLMAPPQRLCTDNAAMIAWAGYEKHMAGHADPGDLVPRPRWPLDDQSAPLLGSGKKGAKA